MKYFICSIVHCTTFSGIVLGVFLLNIFGNLSDLWATVCVVCMQIVFLYANTAAIQRHRIGERSK